MELMRLLSIKFNGEWVTVSALRGKTRSCLILYEGNEITEIITIAGASYYREFYNQPMNELNDELLYTNHTIIDYRCRNVNQLVESPDIDIRLFGVLTNRDQEIYRVTLEPCTATELLELI